MLKQVNLGNQGLVVPTIGLGCMGMTPISDMEIYGKANEQEAIATIHRSLEPGGNLPKDTCPSPVQTTLSYKWNCC